MSEISEPVTTTEEATTNPTVGEETTVVEKKPALATFPETFETVASLLPKLNWLAKVITRNPTVPILENFLFDQGAIFSSDLVVSAMYYTNIKGSFLIPGKQLITILKSCEKTDEISFRGNAETYMLEVLINGEPTFNIASENCNDYPKISIPTETVAEIQNPNDFESFDLVKDYTSTDDLRPAMKCVYVIGNEMVATEGHKLVRRPCHSVVIHEPDFHLMLDRKSIGLMKDFEHATVRRKTDTYKNEDSEKPEITYTSHLMFKENDRAVVLRYCDERYPDYTKVWPETLNVKVNVDKKKLVDTLKLALVAANKTTRQVKLKIVNGTDELNIQSEDLDFNLEFNRTLKSGVTLDWQPFKYKTFKKETNAEGQVIYEPDMPTVPKMKEVEETESLSTGDVFEIGFNGEFLLGIVNDIDNKNIEIAMHKPNKAAVVGGEFLLMPIMLNQYV